MILLLIMMVLMIIIDHHYNLKVIIKWNLCLSLSLSRNFILTFINLSSLPHRDKGIPRNVLTGMMLRGRMLIAKMLTGKSLKIKLPTGKMLSNNMLAGKTLSETILAGEELKQYLAHGLCEAPNGQGGVEMSKQGIGW